MRNDNPTAEYQVDSPNAVTSEKRLNFFLERNRSELERNGWVSVGYIHGDLNTSGGLTKATSSASSGSLLNGNKFRIVTEFRKTEIRKKITRVGTIYRLS